VRGSRLSLSESDHVSSSPTFVARPEALLEESETDTKSDIADASNVLNDADDEKLNASEDHRRRYALPLL